MKKNGFTHDSIKNKTVDWYTPKWLFDELGIHFDLDPCQPKEKIDWIPVTHHFCEEDDGLVQEWWNNVWLNPPYGKHTKAWLEKLDKHGEGIALVFSRTDCKWFHDVCTKADGILFLKGRIKFVDGLGKTGGSGAGSGSMLVAWGVDNSERLKSMGHLGFFVGLNQYEYDLK